MVLLIVRLKVSHCAGCDFTHLGRFTNDMRLRDLVAPHSHLYSNSVSCREAQNKHAYTSILD